MENLLMAADLNGTISALKGGLTSIPAEAAVSNIESWEKELKDAGAPKVTDRQMEKQSDAEVTIEDDMQIHVW